MATLSIQTDAPQINSAFKSVQVIYAWASPTCVVFNSGGQLGLRVDISFSTEVNLGEFVQVLNGSYKGSYRITQLIEGANLEIITDGVWDGFDALSNKFNPDKKQAFQLFGGYSTGAGATPKPYKKIADIQVAMNPTTETFNVELGRYLQSYFQVNPPTAGKDYGLSLPFELTR